MKCVIVTSVNIASFNFIYLYSAGSVYVDFIFTVDVDLGAAQLRVDFNDYLDVNDEYRGYTFDKSITKFQYPGNPGITLAMMHFRHPLIYAIVPHDDMHWGHLWFHQK